MPSPVASISWLTIPLGVRLKTFFDPIAVT
jgi:hypothetical protein